MRVKTRQNSEVLKMQNTIGKLFEMYLLTLVSERNCSETTITSYKTDYNQFLAFCRKSKQSFSINQINTLFLRAYINHLKFGKSFKTNTIRRKIHSLSSFFTFCQENEIIEKNPMLPIKAPKEEKILPVYLNEKDLKKLIDTPKKYSRFESHINRDTAMIAVLAFTGIRRNELLNLNWTDVDFAAKLITVRKGKENKDRKVPIIPPLDLYLWNYLQDRLPMTNPAMFISDKGNRLSTSNYHVIFKRYVRKAGLSDNISSHKIRHTFATLMYQNGVDIRSIQELLGHEDLNTTSIYTHTNLNHLKNEVEKHPLFSR